MIYDDVEYDSEANQETHPLSMATLAHLCGVKTASPRTARVLEIGCGNGENLLAMATYLPEASFVGFDLASTAIERGQKLAPANVELFTADIVEANISGRFDYVIAHGMYSWVPEHVRTALLRLMHRTLTPDGIGFLSLNSLPGWELRRALRDLVRPEVAAIPQPADKVRKALDLIQSFANERSPSGFRAVIAAAAKEYLAHVKEATPKEAPYSRYVFHDLLADCNDPFSIEDLSVQLAQAGLRIVTETPLGRDLGDPFLQVLVQRTDGPQPEPARPRSDLLFWADLTPRTEGGFKTTTGALVHPQGTEGLAAAAKQAPGFVEVADERFAEQLFQGFKEGVFTLVVEEPTLPADLAPHVSKRIESARARGAPDVVITNALHRSFRVSTTPTSADRERLRRHLFVK